MEELTFEVEACKAIQGFYILDIDGIFFRVNKSCTQQIGCFDIMQNCYGVRKENITIAVGDSFSCYNNKQATIMKIEDQDNAIVIDEDGRIFSMSTQSIAAFSIATKLK